MTNFLTTGQVADYCRVTYSTVIRWLKTGKLKSLKGTDQNSHISKKDFIEFLHAHNLPVSIELIENDRKRLLIVDDDVTILDFLRELLSDIDYIEIETTNHGREAGHRITAFKPHVIILDLWMPGINGFEICRHLKYNPETSSIKILAITGYPCEQSIRKITNMGADYILEKPLDTEQLRRVVLDMIGNGNKYDPKANSH